MRIGDKTLEYQDLASLVAYQEQPSFLLHFAYVVMLCIHVASTSVGEVQSGPVWGHFCWTRDWMV